MAQSIKVFIEACAANPGTSVLIGIFLTVFLLIIQDMVVQGIRAISGRKPQ